MCGVAPLPYSDRILFFWTARTVMSPICLCLQSSARRCAISLALASLLTLLTASFYGDSGGNARLYSELPSSPSPSSSNVLITVKTTRRFHQTRVHDIVNTWFTYSPESVYFITDAEDQALNNLTGGHLVVAECPASHGRQALCCKLEAEYDTYMKSTASWWCHFDDDNYVNIPQLRYLLATYDPEKDWYLGRTSTPGPIEIPIPVRRRYEMDDSRSDETDSAQTFSFWFATGGAGFCVSRSLAVKMTSYALDGRFESLCDRIRLPDDVTLGYLIAYFLGRNVTVVLAFHSHMESVPPVSKEKLRYQMSFGVKSRPEKLGDNGSRMFGDSIGMMELHCLLEPESDICKR